MATKEQTALEQKIDTLVKEFERARQERKRERILSKMDGLYYVLISLSIFASGLMISQHSSLRVTSLFPLTGFLLSMLASFAIGFKGMISDSMENRILAWCLLIGSIIWVSAITIMMWVNVVFGLSNQMFGIWGNVASFVAGVVIGGVIGVFQMVVSVIFTRWIEVRLSSLLGENVEVRSIVLKRIGRYTFALIFVSLALTTVIGLVL